MYNRGIKGYPIQQSMIMNSRPSINDNPNRFIDDGKHICTSCTKLKYGGNYNAYNMNIKKSMKKCNVTNVNEETMKILGSYDIKQSKNTVKGTGIHNAFPFKSIINDNEIRKQQSKVNVVESFLDLRSQAMGVPLQNGKIYSSPYDMQLTCKDYTPTGKVTYYG